MELYFAATGVKHELDLFETLMQGQVCALPFTDKDGNKMVQPLNAILSPINLYRFIFPKEYLDEFVKMLDLGEERYPMFNLQQKSFKENS